jgi:hypothetical protein
MIFLVPILILILYIRVTELTYYLLIAFILSLLIPVVLTVTVMQIDPLTEDDENDADLDPYVSMVQVFTGGLIGDFDPMDPQTENGAFWVEYAYAVLLLATILGFASIFTGGPPDVLIMPAGIAHRMWTGSEHGDPIVPHGKKIDTDIGTPIVVPGEAGGGALIVIFLVFYASFFVIVGLFVAVFGSFFTMIMLMALSYWWYNRHLSSWKFWERRAIRRSRRGRKFDPSRL